MRGQLRAPVQHAMDHTATLPHDLAGNLQHFVDERFELHLQPCSARGVAMARRDWQQQRRIDPAARGILFEAATSSGTFQLHEDGQTPCFGPMDPHPVNPDWVYVVSHRNSGRLALWSLSAKQEIAHFDGLEVSPFVIRVSADGRRRFAHSSKRKHFVWDATTGKVITEFDAPNFPGTMAISPNGNRAVIAASDGHLEESSLDPPSKLWELRPWRSRIHRVHYFDNGRKIAMAFAGGVSIGDAPADGQNKPTSKPNAGGLDRSITVSFKRTPLRDAVAEIGQKGGFNIELDGDAMKAGGFTKNLAMTFAVTDKPAREVLGEIIKQQAKLVVVEVDGKYRLTTRTQAKDKQQTILVPATLKSGMRLADAQRDKLLISGGRHSWALTEDNKKIVTGTFGGDVELWDAETGAKLHTFAKHDEWVPAITCSPAEPHIVFLSGYAKGNIRRLNLETLTSENIYTLGGAATSLSVSKAGKRVLVATGGGSLDIFDATSGERVDQIAGARAPACDRPDDPNVVFFTRKDSTSSITEWNLSERKEVRRYKASTPGFSSVTVSAEGQRLAADCGNIPYANGNGPIDEIHVWSTATGDKLATLKHESTQFGSSAAFSADAKPVWASGNSTVQFEIATGERLSTSKQSGVIRCFHDGRRVLIAGSNGIELWRLREVPAASKD